jgi:hypothetical protein
MGSFTASEKVFLFDLFVGYTGFFVFFIFMMIGQIILGLVILVSICVAAIPGSTIWYLIYSKKVVEEIGSIRFHQVTFYDLNGKPRHFEFAVKNFPPKEIETNDMNVSNFENTINFKKKVEELQRKEDIVSITNNEGYYVDYELGKKYEGIGLETSEQIYCWEVINFLLIDSESDPFKKESNKELISKIKNEIIGKENLGDKTAFLIEVLNKVGGSKKLIEKYNDYVAKSLKLKDIEKVGSKEVKVLRKRIVKNIISFLLVTTIVVMLNIVLVNIVGINSMLKDFILTVVLFGYIILLIMGLYIVFVINKSETIQSAIQFYNVVTSNIEQNVLCYLKTKTDAFFPKPYIYKIELIHQTIKQKELIIVTPDEWEKSFDYFMGMKYFKGFPVAVQSTPITLQQIGVLFEETPVCLTLCCSLYSKVNERIIFNHKVQIDWIKKIYLHVIASQKIDNDTKVFNEGLLKSKINSLAELITDQNENGRDTSELQTNTVQKTQKSFSSTNNAQSSVKQPENLLDIIKNNKSLKIFIVAIVGIIFALIFLTIFRG